MNDRGKGVLEEKIPNNLIELLTQIKEDGVPETEYYIRIENFLEIKSRNKGIPRTGSFELTPLCNLDCKMCYIHLNKGQLNGTSILSVEQWKGIIHQANKLGMQKVKLTGGECLTYPQFDELYIYLNKLGILTTIKTNGILLNDKRIELFSKYPPKSIVVSIYGSSERDYENVTGFKQFNVVMNNIKKALNAKLPIILMMTPNIHMRDGERIIEVAKELNAPLIINNFLIEAREETNRDSLSLDCSISQYVHLLIKKKLTDGEIVTSVGDEKLPPFRTDLGEVKYGIPCAAGRSSFHIDWKGMMYACVMLPEMKSNCLTMGFKDAWEEVKNQAEKYQNPIECQSCSYSKVCCTCPAYQRNSLPGHANTKVCEYTRRLVKEGILKSEYVNDCFNIT